MSFGLGGFADGTHSAPMLPDVRRFTEGLVYISLSYVLRMSLAGGHRELRVSNVGHDDLLPWDHPRKARRKARAP